MLFWYLALAAAPPLLLLTAGLVPSRWADRHVAVLRLGTVWLFAGALSLALGAAAMLWRYGPLDSAPLQLAAPLPLNLGVYFDGLAAVMLLLISFVGLTIAAFSVRYLHNEAGQGRFLRWMAFTIGAVLLLVVSRNLLMFTAAWMLTSFGLHQLLTHYGHRPWAVWAARKKFLISRLGDLMLIAALVLTYQSFGSFDYSEVFAAAQTRQATGTIGWQVSLIGLLYVFGAMTKSAQFPFHSWLPDTMETPTPVSALMHAGIINAGGFLIIRLSPLVSLSPLALDLLALFGAFTALSGGVVMLTQPSVKRSLAYSTIAQMGFMMLQCGLGAFSAALLHIVAHSVYKAHAFLSSGSVLEAAARRKVDLRPAWQGPRAWALLPVAFLGALLLAGSAGWLLGIDFATKPGAPVLGLILAVALTHLLWQALTAGSGALAARGAAACLLVSCGYFAGYLLMDHVLSWSEFQGVVATSWLHPLVVGLVAVGFAAVFVLQAVVASSPFLPGIRALYVHALNGFYFDVPARRLTARVWGRNTPTP